MISKSKKKNKKENSTIHKKKKTKKQELMKKKININYHNPLSPLRNLIVTPLSTINLSPVPYKKKK